MPLQEKSMTASLKLKPQGQLSSSLDPRHMGIMHFVQADKYVHTHMLECNLHLRSDIWKIED